MNYEVEAKAWIKDRKELIKKIKRIGRFLRHEEKYDQYFSLKNSEKTAFRIRTCNGENIVTMKKKKLCNKIETNEEQEFMVSDANIFCTFATSLGYHIRYTKKKSTDLFEINSYSVEINEVESLGVFLEIEKICKKKSEIAPAQKEILEIFEVLEIPTKSLETRGYEEMLRTKTCF